MLTHHAYFYEGSLSQLGELTEAARKLGGFKKEENTDVIVREYEKFTIDDARKLRDLASLKSVSGKSLFIIGAGAIHSEAQQALLKLFEEPQVGAIFVLFIPHGSLLPTLKSRCLPFPPLDSAKPHLTGQAVPFLRASYKERQAIIADLLDEDEGVRERVRDFLNTLEETIYTKLEAAKEKEELVENLSDIARFRSYLSDRAPSLKMMLEHLAASIPKA